MTPRTARGRWPSALPACLTAAAALALAWSPEAHAAAKAEIAPSAASGVEDPFEGLNRVFYKINHVVDRALLRPLALGYQKITPKPLRNAIHNVLTELGEPLVFTNDVLQLRPKRAAGTAVRFVANATIGVGGLFDRAAKMGLPHHDNGFGDTLGRYGIKPGPYVFLPLLGPSDFRDLIGIGVDTYADPVRLVNYPYSNTVTVLSIVVGGIDERARAEEDLQQVEQMGTDPYATLRSLYLQNKQAEIRGEAPLKIEQLPDFGDPGADAAPAVAPNAPTTPAETLPQAPAPAPTTSSDSGTPAAAQPAGGAPDTPPPAEAAPAAAQPAPSSS